MHRIISYLYIPCFYWQIQSLFFPEIRTSSAVIGGDIDNYGIVLEVPPFLRQSGIRPGMLSTQARQLLGEVRFVPPEEDRYDFFLKKIMTLIDGFSLKMLKHAYNGFFIFLPDYFQLVSVIKEIQYKIFKQWGLHTKVGLSHNKYVARLAAHLSHDNDVLHINTENTARVLRRASIDLLDELHSVEIDKLKLAGINTVYDLFRLDLYQLRFFLGDKGEMLYYNYIQQIKTVREETQFIYDELFFYNTINNAEKVIQLIKKRVKELIQELIWKDRTAKRLKIYLEYVDNKTMIFTRKLKRDNSIKEIFVHIISFFRFIRRVRIKRVSIYFFYHKCEIKQLWSKGHQIEELFSLLK